MSDRDYWRDAPGRSAFWATYPATKAILIGLPAVHLVLAMIGAADPNAASAITGFLALRPSDVVGRLHVWQLVTYSIVHEQGIWHLLWNCVGIFFFGRLVEQRIGSRRYLLFALSCVVAAGLGFLLLSAIKDTRTAMIGASGFDFGVLIVCALWYPNMTVLLMFLISVPLWLLATIFAFTEVYMLFAVVAQADGIAHSAHVAGGLYGLLYWRYGERIDGIAGMLERWRAQHRWRRQQADRRAADELRGEVDRILDKVNREGMASLTDAERRALKEASERLRR